MTFEVYYSRTTCVRRQVVWFVLSHSYHFKNTWVTIFRLAAKKIINTAHRTKLAKTIISQKRRICIYRNENLVSCFKTLKGTFCKGRKIFKWQFYLFQQTKRLSYKMKVTNLKNGLISRLMTRMCRTAKSAHAR